MRDAFWMCGVMVLLSGAARAQAPGPQDPPLPTLKLSTRLVQVSALVLDEHGILIRGLGKDDFVLKQDGRDQEIRYFSEDGSLPLTLALLVDTSGSQTMFLQDEIMASEKFYRAMLTRPADRASLLQFDSTVLERQPLTSSVTTLENSLRYLDMRHASAAPGRGGTLLYDAICAAAATIPGQERGRRAMVILTDGEDNGSRATLDFAIASAQRADVVIYSVLYSAEKFVSGLDRRGPTEISGRKVMESLSNATGGRVFEAGPEMPLNRIYEQIAEDLRLQYQIAYTPADEKAGTYHKIELKLKAKTKHVTVEARQGYYSPK